MVVDSAEKLIGHKIPMPDDVGNKAIEQMPDVSQADYLLALEIDRRSLAAGDKVLHVARDVLKGEVRETSSVLNKAQGELEKLEFAAKRRMLEASDWKEEQLGEMPSLMKTLRGKGVALNLLFPAVGTMMELTGLPIVRAVLQVPKDMPNVSTYDGSRCYRGCLSILSVCSVMGVVQLHSVRRRATVRHGHPATAARKDRPRVSRSRTRRRSTVKRRTRSVEGKTVWEATRCKQRGRRRPSGLSSHNRMKRPLPGSRAAFSISCLVTSGLVNAPLPDVGLSRLSFSKRSIRNAARCRCPRWH